jgi:glycosyltransferase involved in cell wall biosynthesis
MTVSQYVKSKIDAAFRAQIGEVGILLNGIEIIDVPTKEEVQSARQDVLTELSLPDAVRLLLTVGRLSSEKGHADLLEIAPSIVSTKIPMSYSSGPATGLAEESPEEQVRRRGLEQHVRILGYRTDIYRLLNACDLLLHPSRLEGGCSSAIREAMVTCVPLVCSDAGGITEIVRDGVHGLVFPATDINRMFDRGPLLVFAYEDMSGFASKFVGADLIDDLSRGTSPCPVRSAASRPSDRPREFRIGQENKGCLTGENSTCLRGGRLHRTSSRPSPDARGVLGSRGRSEIAAVRQIGSG